MLSLPQIARDPVMLGERVADILNNNLCLAEAAGISPKGLEAIYSLGYTEYQAGSYTQALKIFSWLCQLHHLDVHYFKALAATLEASGDLKAAVEAYGYTALLDVDDPEPSYRAAICLAGQGHMGQALQAVEAAQAQIEDLDAEDQAKYATLAQEIKMLHKILKTDSSAKKE